MNPDAVAPDVPPSDPDPSPLHAAQPEAQATADHALVPLAAQRAFAAGDEREALTLLWRERDRWPAGSRPWALLERLGGVVLIHLLREVEGTFALERADALLDQWDTGRVVRPDLEWLEEPSALRPEP